MKIKAVSLGEQWDQLGGATNKNTKGNRLLLSSAVADKRTSPCIIYARRVF